MIRRDVERVEVVVVRFDLGAEHHRKPQAFEVGAGVLRDPADGVDRAGLRDDRRKRHVGGQREVGLQAAALQRLFRRAQGGFHAFDPFVDRLSGGGAFGVGQLADAAAQQRHVAAASEEIHADFLEPALVGGCVERRRKAAL